MNEILEEMAARKAQINQLQAEYDELKDRALEGMLASDTTSVKTLYGTFTVGQRKAYEMPEWFRDSEQSFKLDKAKAQSWCKEKNRYSLTPYLIFTPVTETLKETSNQVRIH